MTFGIWGKHKYIYAIYLSISAFDGDAPDRIMTRAEALQKQATRNDGFNSGVDKILSGHYLKRALRNLPFSRKALRDRFAFLSEDRSRYTDVTPYIKQAILEYFDETPEFPMHTISAAEYSFLVSQDAPDQAAHL